MGRELQKRKNRSSRPSVRPKVLGRTKAGKKKVNFLGSEAVAKNWDRNLTLEQNYARLGLSTKLNSMVTAPRKRKGTGRIDEPLNRDSLAIKPSTGDKNHATREAQVVRDSETGEIIKVLDPEEERARRNPLNDPLNDVDNGDDENEQGKEAPKSHGSNVIAALEAQVALEDAQIAKKRPRQQSQREEEWLASLVAKHGDDTQAMFRDRKLNPMQQSEGDIRRRVKKWKAKHA